MIEESLLAHIASTEEASGPQIHARSHPHHPTNTPSSATRHSGMCHHLHCNGRLGKASQKCGIFLTLVPWVKQNHDSFVVEIRDDFNPALNRKGDMAVILSHWETRRNSYAQPQIARLLGFTIGTELSKSISGTKYWHKSEGHDIASRQLKGSGDLENQSISSPQHHFRLCHLQTCSVILSTGLLTAK